jgi:hypothetical protein
MKMRALTLLALLGLVTAEEAAHGDAHGGGHGEAKWFWRAQDAAASEARAVLDWPANTKGGKLMAASFSL